LNLIAPAEAGTAVRMLVRRRIGATYRAADPAR
jgi:hypothetical protein